MATIVNRMKSLPELRAEIVHTTGEIATLKRRKIDLEAQMEKRCQSAQRLMHDFEDLKMHLEKEQELLTTGPKGLSLAEHVWMFHNGRSVYAVLLLVIEQLSL